MCVGGGGAEGRQYVFYTQQYLFFFFLIAAFTKTFTRQCGDQPRSLNTGSQPEVILLFLGGLAMSRDIPGCRT